MKKNKVIFMDDKNALERIADALENLSESNPSESIANTLEEILNSLKGIENALGTISAYCSRKDDELIRQQRKTPNQKIYQKEQRK